MDTERVDGAGTRTGTLGGGCFWCLEAGLRSTAGLERVTSGYAGGHVESPTYRQVCGGRTGHAEVVRLEYDPEVIDFQPLETFYLAEPEHQDYYLRNPGQGYCRVVIDPKVAKLRASCADRLKPDYGE